jgi:hypothetical protein
VVVLEEALKEALRLDRVFNSIKSRPSGIKFIVTIITILNTILCLISNYNSKDTPIRDLSKLTPPCTSTKTNILGYKHLCAKKITNEVLL